MENITVFNGSQPLKIGLPLHDVDTIHSEVWRQTLMIVPLPAMIVYDYIMTIPEEINVLWRRKKTFSSLALLVNRYGLLLLAISLVALLFPVYGDLMTNKRCRVGIPVGSVAMILVLVSVISFDTLRIYAIMQKSILAGLSVAALGVTWLVLWIITPAQKGFVATFSNGAQLGCQGKLIILPTNVHTVLSRMYLRDGINIALEALVIGITLFRTLGLRKEASKAGVKLSIGDLLLQDGSLQFGIILLFSILDISMIKTLGEPIPTIIIKSIITSHFAFHLRQVHLGSSSNQTQTRSLMSSLRFTVVGNVGAPVHNVFSESQNDMNPEGDGDEVQFSNDPISTILEIPISSSPQGEV